MTKRGRPRERPDAEMRRYLVAKGAIEPMDSQLRAWAERFLREDDQGHRVLDEEAFHTEVIRRLADRVMPGEHDPTEPPTSGARR